MEEYWKQIKEYPDYQVSNYGRVKNKRGRILKSKISSGYSHITLSKNKTQKEILVHRVEMISFVPNPDNLPCVNHKDENKLNNFIWVNPDGSIDPEKSNLEWCSYSYNITYSAQKRRGEISPNTFKQSIENKREYNKRWNKNNPEKVKEAVRKWQKKNPEKVKEYKKRYRERLKVIP